MYGVLLLLYSIRRLLHVSASMCHLQGASYVLVSYLKTEMVMLFVMNCECWWAVCSGCCGYVCYVVQLCALVVVVLCVMLGIRNSIVGRSVSHFLQATKALRESRGIALLCF
jgi:hypothetical protein